MQNGSGGSAGHHSNGQTITLPNASAYFDILARLPPQPVVEELIRMYFSDENWSFPVLDEHRFRLVYEDFKKQRGEAWPPATKICSSPALVAVPALLFSVLAVALQFISTESDVARALSISSPDECDRLSQHFVHSGQEMIHSVRRCKPSTTAIEYHLSTCIWYKNSGNGGEAW